MKARPVLRRALSQRARWSLLAAALLVAGCGTLREGGGAGVGVAPLPLPKAPPLIVAPAPLSRAPEASAPRAAPLAVEHGIASWYGRPFHGRRTASGEVYDMHALTAAHRTLPLRSYVRVRNPANGREVVVRVNDRGPFVRGRVIDLSYAAARRLGIAGIAPVDVLRLAPHDAQRLLAAAR
jgi:rare lipoprotein A